MRILVVWMLIMVGSAGCADEGVAGPDDDGLIAGMGVIRGLLVDDRFRPLAVADGSIVIAESAQTLGTNENGEFQSPPLAPGAYTLRFAIDDHETPAQTVRVAADQITETSVVARRIANLDDLVVSWDHAFFVPCTIAFVASPMQFDCMGDQSGDTDRSRITVDPTAFPDARFLLSELLLNRDAGDIMDGTYTMQVKSERPDTGGVNRNFAAKVIDEGRYDRIVIEKGVLSEWQDDPILPYLEWQNEDPVVYHLWGHGQARKQLNDAGVPAPYGAGVQLGTKAQVLVTLFLGDDRAAVDAFCAFC